MKRAFTIIEMLIVVAVMVTLMSMVFRLTSIGGSATARNVTVSRLQRLENCLSGYYAAFGTYPPVKLHGTRDINYKVSGHGLQTSDEQEVNWNNASEAWQQVQAACKAQPVDVAFPFPDGYAAKVEAVSKALQHKASGNQEEYKAFWSDPAIKAKLTSPFDSAPNPQRFLSFGGDTEWRDLQLFKFGLLSYLLPRYLVMMNCNQAYFRGQFSSSNSQTYKQWWDNNSQPANPLTGEFFQSWEDVQEYAQSDNASDLAKVINIPSQAICARWMPNLEGVCSAEHVWKLFGINITGSLSSNVSDNNPYIEVFTPGSADDDNGSTSEQYVLDSITVQDGWGSTLYYYSPAPHQSYVLWSAGPNGRTFPPWIPLDSDKIKGNDTAKSVISNWIQDDIVNMSN